MEELPAIRQACLSFRITLLDQRHIQHDYDSAIVCALAVLSVKSAGWKGVDQYPSILSKIIKIARFKIARFMIVQKAFDKVQPPVEFAARQCRRYRATVEQDWRLKPSGR